MKPKDKAKELCLKFSNTHGVEIKTFESLITYPYSFDAAKSAAKICVTEIIGTDMLNNAEEYVETVRYLNFWFHSLIFKMVLIFFSHALKKTTT